MHPQVCSVHEAEDVAAELITWSQKLRQRRTGLMKDETEPVEGKRRGRRDGEVEEWKGIIQSAEIYGQGLLSPGKTIHKNGLYGNQHGGPTSKLT
eukprot:749277-Hanusia_phi.AAC.3